MKRGITRVVLALVLLLFAFPTRAANPTKVKVVKDGELGLDEYSTSPTAVLIDIKPGSDRNPINCTNKKGVITVAVLTTEDFDAITVDHTTVTFEGASETHVNKKKKEPRRHEEDVDKDRDIDLVFHFRIGETNLTCGSTEGTLIGETFDGQQIRGTDAVNPIPPYYYTTLLNDPQTSQSAVSIGLLSFGFFVGLALVLGSPTQLKRRRKR